jgi:hypothetical protein
MAPRAPPPPKTNARHFFIIHLNHRFDCSRSHYWFIQLDPPGFDELHQRGQTEQQSRATQQERNQPA